MRCPWQLNPEILQSRSQNTSRNTPNRNPTKQPCIISEPHPPSQVLPPRSRNPLPKHRTPQLPLHTRKRAHDRLDPDLKHLSKELPYRLFRLRARRIIRYTRTRAAR